MSSKTWLTRLGSYTPLVSLVREDWVVEGRRVRPHVVAVHPSVALAYGDLRAYPYRSHRELSKAPLEIWVGPMVQRELRRLAEETGSHEAREALSSLSVLREETSSVGDDVRFRFHEDLPPYLARISELDQQLKAYAEEAGPPVTILSLGGDDQVFRRGTAAHFLKAVAPEPPVGRADEPIMHGEPSQVMDEPASDRPNPVGAPGPVVRQTVAIAHVDDPMNGRVWEKLNALERDFLIGDVFEIVGRDGGTSLVRVTRTERRESLAADLAIQREWTLFVEEA